MIYNLDDLQYQLRWAGQQLANTGYLVCPTCLDVPNQQERTLVLPPDPPPVYLVRPIRFAVEDDFITSEGGTQILDENDTTSIVPEGDGNT
jgi:hypothetical protein